MSSGAGSPLVVVIIDGDETQVFEYGARAVQIDWNTLNDESAMEHDWVSALEDGLLIAPHDVELAESILDGSQRLLDDDTDDKKEGSGQGYIDDVPAYVELMRQLKERIESAKENAPDAP